MLGCPSGYCPGHPAPMYCIIMHFTHYTLPNLFAQIRTITRSRRLSAGLCTVSRCKGVLSLAKLLPEAAIHAQRCKRMTQ